MKYSEWAGQYTLDEHKPVACYNLFEWGKFMGGNNRRVAETIRGGIRVSTVFLGVDHSFGTDPPALFETMVFGGPLDDEQDRCSTWEQAEVMHEMICEKAFANELREAIKNSLKKIK